MQNYRDNIMQYRANRQMAPCCEKKDALEGMPLAMAYVPWQQWKNPYGPERGLAQGTIFSELDLAFDKGRCS